MTCTCPHAYQIVRDGLVDPGPTITVWSPGFEPRDKRDKAVDRNDKGGGGWRGSR